MSTQDRVTACGHVGRERRLRRDRAKKSASHEPAARVAGELARRAGSSSRSCQEMTVAERLDDLQRAHPRVGERRPRGAAEAEPADHDVEVVARQLRPARASASAILGDGEQARHEELLAEPHLVDVDVERRVAPPAQADLAHRRRLPVELLEAGGCGHDEQSVPGQTGAHALPVAALALLLLLALTALPACSGEDAPSPPPGPDAASSAPALVRHAVVRAGRPPRPGRRPAGLDLTAPAGAGHRPARRRGGWPSCRTATRWSASATAPASCACPPAAAQPESRSMRAAAGASRAARAACSGSRSARRTPQDGLVYAYLTAADDNRIVRFRARRARSSRCSPASRRRGIHNGGRLAFGPDGNLYAGTGDAGDTDAVAGRPRRSAARCCA